MQDPRYISISVTSHYYPFGMQMPERTYTANSVVGYGFGFNGKLKDDDIEGDGNWQDYGKREYLPRLGRFVSADPLEQNYAWYTPYQFAGNKPIVSVDIDGLEEFLVTNFWKDGKIISTRITEYKDTKGNQVNVHFMAHGKEVTNQHILVQNINESGKRTSFYGEDAFSKSQQNVIDNGIASKPNQVLAGGSLNSETTANDDLFVTYYDSRPPVGLPPAPTQKKMKIDADFGGGEWKILNKGSLIKQLRPIINLLNSDPCATLVIMGNVGGNSKTRTWDSPSSVAGINLGQLATKRAQSIITLMKENGLKDPSQVVNGGHGKMEGGYNAKGIVKYKD